MPPIFSSHTAICLLYTSYENIAHTLVYTQVSMCTYRFEYLSHDNTCELVNTCAHASRYISIMISVVWVCEYMYLN